MLHARATRTVEVLLTFVKQQNEIAAPFVALPDFLYIFFNGVPATPVVISFAKIVEYQQNRTLRISIAVSYFSSSALVSEAVVVAQFNSMLFLRL